MWFHLFQAAPPPSPSWSSELIFKKVPIVCLVTHTWPCQAANPGQAAHLLPCVSCAGPGLMRAVESALEMVGVKPSPQHYKQHTFAANSNCHPSADGAHILSDTAPSNSGHGKPRKRSSPQGSFFPQEPPKCESSLYKCYIKSGL